MPAVRAKRACVSDEGTAEGLGSLASSEMGH
jgi:hypothetical protein